MYPRLFELGPITLYTYGVLLAAAYLIGLKLAMVRAKARGLDANRVLDLGIYIIISALVGAKLLLLVTDFRTFNADPHELLTLARSGSTCSSTRSRASSSSFSGATSAARYSCSRRRSSFRCCSRRSRSRCSSISRARRRPSRNARARPRDPDPHRSRGERRRSAGSVPRVGAGGPLALADSAADQGRSHSGRRPGGEIESAGENRSGHQRRRARSR